MYTYKLYSSWQQLPTQGKIRIDMENYTFAAVWVAQVKNSEPGKITSLIRKWNHITVGDLVLFSKRLRKKLDHGLDNDHYAVLIIQKNPAHAAYWPIFAALRWDY